MSGKFSQFWQAQRTRPRTGAVLIEYALASAAVGVLTVALLAPLWPQTRAESGTSGLLAPLAERLLP